MRIETVSESTGVLYCGTCGSLNPRTNHYCSACGHQLVDAYHASEGLRVYSRPDRSASLIEIVDPGTEITGIDSEDILPSEFIKVALPDGRIGYIQLREIESLLEATGPDTSRREPVGCISSTALLLILVLAMLSSALIGIIAWVSDDSSTDFLLFLSCLTVVPLFLVIVFFYLYTRKREQEIMGSKNLDS